MRRYLIYAAVYGTIGVCVGLAMAYASKDGQPYFALIGTPRKKSNMIDLPEERLNHSVSVATEEVEALEEIE